MTLSFKIMEEILNVLDEDEIHDYKAIRRNAEKNMKDHAYKAKQFEKRSDKAIEQGRERKAEVLYDKANDEWDQETREQQRAAQAHHRVEQLRKYSRNEALEVLESLKSYILKKDLEEAPNKAMVSDKRMKQYDKADELKRKAFSQIVDNAGGIKKLIDSKRDTTKNKEGEEKTDFRRNFLDQERVEINRENDPHKEQAIKKSIARHSKKVQEALDIMEEILNVVDENIYDAIEKHVKDPKKKEELHDKAFDNYVQDDVDQQDRIEKRLTGGKEGNIEAWEKAFDIKRSHDVTKNIKGEAKTDMRSGIHRVSPNVERDQDEFREQEKEYRRSKLNKPKLNKPKSQNINCALDIIEQIMNVVDEDIKSAIIKKHGEPKYNNDQHHHYHDFPNAIFDAGLFRTPRKNSKSAKLIDRVEKTQRDEQIDSDIRSGQGYHIHGSSQMRNKRYETKQSKGEKKTEDRRDWFKRRRMSGRYPGEYKSDEQRVSDSIVRHNKKEQKKSSLKETFSLMEQICDFADNLFELDIENKQNISPNKISKVKKDKDGKDVEVVSVADELFPHDGTAKQQFDKKILDKINDMIEGTGSLEDLIQFVRKGVANKKLAHEGLSESMHKQVSKKLEKGEITSNQAMDLDKKIETKMSPEKQYQEEEEGRAEDSKTNPHSLDRYITRVATGKSIKRARKEGKIPHPAPRYKDGCVFAGDPTPKRASQTKNVVFPSRNESLDVSEDKNIFGKETGKGDLLNDIDTGLGSPVKKRFNDLKNKVVGCKEAFDLMEEIINEVSDKFKLKGIGSGVDKFEKMRDNADKEEDPKKKEKLETEAIKYGHKVNVQIDKINNKQKKRIKAEEEAKKLEKSKESGC